MCRSPSFGCRLHRSKMHLHFSHLPVVFGVLASVSGQEQLLMVFGGRSISNYLNNVTLLSLDGGPVVPECLKNLGPPPKRLYSACQATLGEGKLTDEIGHEHLHNTSLKTAKLPHVCGGRYWEGNFEGLENYANDKCYSYDPGKIQIHHLFKDPFEEITTPQSSTPGQSLGL